jgi:hypothetical protein
LLVGPALTCFNTSRNKNLRKFHKGEYIGVTLI